MNERIGVTYAEAETDEEGNLTLTTYGVPLDRLARMLSRPGRAFQGPAAEAKGREWAREGLVYGRLHVKGKILVHSNVEVLAQGYAPVGGTLVEEAELVMDLACPLLNRHMENNTSFQIILSVMQDSYPEGLGLKKFVFDGCHVDDREFQLDSHGYAVTAYTFTADRIREE